MVDRVRLGLYALLAAGACTGAGEIGPDTEDTSPPPEVLSASCAAQPGSVLRWDCDVALQAPGAVDVAFREVGTDPWRVQPSAVVDASEHRVVLYDLRAQSEWEWTAGVARSTWAGRASCSKRPLGHRMRYRA